MIANTAKLRDWLRQHKGVDLPNYEATRQWSVQYQTEFWQAMWDYFEIDSATPYSAVLMDANMPGARWFVGAQLNYCAHLLRHVQPSDAAGMPAVVFRNERLQREGRSVEVSWSSLMDQTATLAACLQTMGVQPGDRVAAYLPNIVETVVGFLACASIGAVWSLCAPDMGVATVRDRFRQIDPKVLIACDGCVYGGKAVDRRQTVVELLAQLPSVYSLILVECLQTSGATGGPYVFERGDWSGETMLWRDALSFPARQAPIALPFDHPLWIVYSSGTTGLPKPIVHGHGGVLLELLKLLHFHLDLRASTDPSNPVPERLHWYSSSGWVMWNLQISALLVGTTVCIYDGNPSYPEPDTLWAYADQVRATFVGAGAAYFTGCVKAGVIPGKNADLSRVRALGATGSPLPPKAYEWGQQQFGPDIWWAVISGGTDIASAFLAGTPELPTVPGEMQARCLGADVQAWSEWGEPLIDQVGELVCVQPMPSMPLYFWGDQGNKRYIDSYFDVYPAKEGRPAAWRHGDWLRITPSGSTIIYGRSDATLNRHGHRMGTSELYRVVEAIPEIIDSLVVDVEHLGRPSFMPLFVVLRPGVQLDDWIKAEVRKCIREQLSPRFVPDEIVQVAEIPRTLTGKKQELPVKKLLLGRALNEVVNIDACANPGAFDWYQAYAAGRA